MCISDKSRGYISATEVVVVCAIVEFSTTAMAIAVAIFGRLVTAVAVAGCDECEN